MIKILVISSGNVPEAIKSLADEASIHQATFHDDDIQAQLASADVLLLWDFFSVLLEENWDFLSKVQWIHIPAAGIDKALFPALRESDVLLTRAKSMFGRAMSEYALACVLMHAKELRETMRDSASRAWRIRTLASIHGANVLMVGAGDLAQEIAAQLKVNGMKVSYVATSARSIDGDSVYNIASLAEIVSGFDYVINVLPKTADTFQLIDQDVIDAFSPDTFFINLGRGDTIDQEYLTNALADKKFAGAALDTFVTEPLPDDDPLWDMDNVFVSPHTSSRIGDWQEALMLQFVEYFHQWLAGNIPDGVVDKNKGY